MNANALNVMSGISSKSDVRSSAKNAEGPLDVSGPKATPDVKSNRTGKMPVADDTPAPQCFDQVLSNAVDAQKLETEAPTLASKPAAAQPAPVAAEKAPEPAAPPDMSLLMSLLSALPLSQAAQAKPTQAATPATPTTNKSIDVILPVTSTQAPASNAPAALNLQTPDLKVVTAALPILDAPMADVTSNVVPVQVSVDVVATPVLWTGAVSSVSSTTTQILTLSVPSAPMPIVLDDVPVTHGEWPSALGHRLLWAVGEGVQKVDISVSPNNMGPINVQISIENEQADIRFTAMHAMTREALEASLPRLRDMFSQQGINLSQTQVFSQASHSGHERQPHPQQSHHPQGASAENASSDREREQPRFVPWRRGLVDDYA